MSRASLGDPAGASRLPTPLRVGPTLLLMLACLVAGAEAGGEGRWFARPGTGRDAVERRAGPVLRCGTLRETGPPMNPWPLRP